MSRAASGLLFMAMSAMVLPLGDAFAKEAARIGDVPPFVISFMRFLVGAALFAPLAMAMPEVRGMKLTRIFFFSQLVRGVFAVLAITSMVTAVRHAPLADVFGAFFVAPAVATFLATAILGERVTKLDILSIVLGLIGVVLVTRPGANMNVGLLWALLGGTCFACLNVATRWAAPYAPPLAQVVSQMLLGMLFTAPFALPEIGRAADAPGFVVLSGLGSALSNLLMTMAFARERAAILAPLIYLQLPSAVLIGFAMFGDLPDMLAVAGLALIVVTGFGFRLYAVMKARRS